MGIREGSSIIKPLPRIGVDFHVFDGKFQGSRSHLLGIFSEIVEICPQYKFYFFLENTELLRAFPAFQRKNVELVYMPHGVGA
jgi:hypothetical protein